MEVQCNRRLLILIWVIVWQLKKYLLIFDRYLTTLRKSECNRTKYLGKLLLVLFARCITCIIHFVSLYWFLDPVRNCLSFNFIIVFVLKICNMFMWFKIQKAPKYTVKNVIFLLVSCGSLSTQKQTCKIYLTHIKTIRHIYNSFPPSWHKN